VTMGRRVLLLVPARSYRAADFMLAATKMGLDLTVASDGALPAGGRPVIPAHPVFMVPVARAGVLRAVEGRSEAEAVPGITGVTITIPLGRWVRPLPDGDLYLGFVFAEAVTPDEVEKALTTASQRLRPVIE
jgi:L-amino acid ligase C-terminal domain 2